MKAASMILKRIISLLILVSTTHSSFAQHISVAPDKMNVFYVGVDNPITIVAENCPCNQLVVKASNGTVTGSGCIYQFKGQQVGRAEITVYKRNVHGLKKLGANQFRLKLIPAAAFKIGPYGNSNGRRANKLIIASQQFVRADLENFDYDARFTIDSFHTTISGDSTVEKTYFNISGKISEGLHNAFQLLQKNDVIIFDKIFAKGPDGYERELDSVLLKIAE